MKNLKDYLIREGYLEYDQADDYLKKVKGKEISFAELKKGLEKECYIDGIEFDEKIPEVSGGFNPYNNADGPDVLLTIKLEKDSTEQKLKVLSWDYEEC